MTIAVLVRVNDGFVLASDSADPWPYEPCWKHLGSGVGAGETGG